MNNNIVQIPVDTARRIATSTVWVENHSRGGAGNTPQNALQSSLGMWAHLTTCNSDRTKWTWRAMVPQDDGTLADDPTWGFGDNYDSGYAVEVNQYKFMFENDIVWLTPAKNEEYYVFQYQPPQHYCTITGTGNLVSVCDPTTGWHSNATIWAYSPHDGSVIHNIGGLVQSTWQSTGIDWTVYPPTLSPGRKNSFILGIDRMMPCTFLKWDTSTNKPVVMANPGQQTVFARLKYDTCAYTNGLIPFILGGTGDTITINAWCLPSLNPWLNYLDGSQAAVLPANSPLMITEVYPGTFYAVVTPQNPIAYIQQTYPNASMVLKKLTIPQPLGEGSDLGQQNVTIGFPTSAGFDNNPGIEVTIANGSSPNAGTLAAVSQGFTGMDVAGHAAINGIVGP